MGAVIPAGFAQANLLLRHVSSTYQGEIVLGIDLQFWTGALIDAANAVTLAYDAHMGPKTDIGVAIGPTILHVGAAAPPYLMVTGDDVQGGNLDAQVLPSNCAALGRKFSLQPGRGGRGRNYLPWCLPEDKVDDVGNIDNATFLDLQDAYTAFIQDLNAGTLAGEPLQVYILHSVGASTAADPPAEVTSMSLDRLIVTQRRRLGR